MQFRLTPRSMTLDDLELLQGRILAKFIVISQIWEATTAKRMSVNLRCQGQRNCNPLNLLFKIMFLAFDLSRLLVSLYCIVASLFYYSYYAELKG